MSNLTEIDKLTTNYGSERAVLSGRVATLQRELEEVRARHLPTIRAAVGRCAEKHAKLIAAIEASPELFEKPKSLVINAIKVGFKKGSGKLEIDDEEKTVSLILKHFDADEAELLIKTTRKPIKKALENLDASDLKKIGVSVEDTSDMAFAKPTDTAVDKIVKALLKNLEDTEDEEMRDAA